LAGARHAHIEGYLVFNHALCEAVLNAARAAGCTISLDLSSFEVVNAARDWMLKQFGRGIDIVFANEDEIRALFPGRGATTRRSRGSSRGTDVIAAVKMGREGSWIAKADEAHRIAAGALKDVVDTNGAGDAWAAGFLYGYLRATLPGVRRRLHHGIRDGPAPGPLDPRSAWAEVKKRVLRS
jgi:sugar/nucleoside kinase (ribokinase family)